MRMFLSFMEIGWVPMTGSEPISTVSSRFTGFAQGDYTVYVYSEDTMPLFNNAPDICHCPVLYHR